MKIQITEEQYKTIKKKVEAEFDEQTEAEPVDPEPETGASPEQSGAEGYPEVGKWESGVTRGPGNQLGVTKWSDTVGSTITRGKANPLK